MTNNRQNKVRPRTNGDTEETVPWYKRTPVIVAVIGLVGAIAVGFFQFVLPVIYKSSPDAVSVIGHVSDEQKHTIANAKVSLEGEGFLPPVLFTDSEGVFSFSLPRDVKEIKIRVDATGYVPYDRRIGVSALKRELEDIRLKPETKAEDKAELSGTVLDGSNKDRPLQGAHVTLDDFPGMTPVETSSDGVFNLHDIPKKYGEAVRVRVVMAGYQPNPYTEDVVLGKAPPQIKLTRKR
jgi:hypothetical protein